MGTHVHVRGVSRGKLAGAVRQLLTADGYDIASDREATRRVLIGPAGPWIAVFDEQGGAGGEHERLAARLSGRLGAPSVAGDIRGGALARIVLFRDGEGSAVVEGGGPIDASAWADLADPVPDEGPAALAEALGLSPELAIATYATAREVQLPGGYLTLGFSKPQEAAHPPALHATAAPRLSGRVGGTATVGVSVRNDGGDGEGIEVHLAGDAVGRLLEVLSVQTGATAAAPEAYEDPEHGDAWLEVSLPEVPLPGVPVMKGLDLEAIARLAEARQRAWLSLSIRVRFIEAGRGKLEVLVAPEEGSSAEVQLRVEVD